MKNSNFFRQANICLKKNLYFDKKINHKILDTLGFFVIKNAFNLKIVEKYRLKFLQEISNNKLKKTNNHLVEFKIEKLNFFKKIYKEPKLKQIVKSFYKGNVGSDFYRIVKKDKNNIKPVFCHQDSGYQLGSFDRYSLFISLTTNNNLNGGLIVYPSTHKFGYLGDTGEISKKITKRFTKVCPHLEPGDILVMHSSLWHESDVNFLKSDRIYFEVHIQNSYEPSTKFIICGKKLKLQKNLFDKNKIFSNSRIQRIVSLKNQIKQIKKSISSR